jgi:single-strand binding family protein
MTTMNQFTVSGNLCADAQIKEFKNTTSKILRIGIFINSSRKVENKTITTSAIFNAERWVKKEEMSSFDFLKKGQLVSIKGFFKAESYTDKDTQEEKTVIKCIATEICPLEKTQRNNEEQETKEEEQAEK